MTSEKWQRWLSLPDLYVADFNGQQNSKRKTLKHQNNLWKQHTEINNASSGFNPVVSPAVVSNKTVAIDQAQLHVKWKQWLQICKSSAHGFHTTDVHLVLISSDVLSIDTFTF